MVSSNRIIAVDWHFVNVECDVFRLYPVDKKRVNEFGQSFEEDTAKGIKETKKTQ